RREVRRTAYRQARRGGALDPLRQAEERQGRAGRVGCGRGGGLRGGRLHAQEQEGEEAAAPGRPEGSRREGVLLVAGAGMRQYGPSLRARQCKRRSPSGKETRNGECEIRKEKRNLRSAFRFELQAPEHPAERRFHVAQRREAGAVGQQGVEREVGGEDGF